MPSFVPQTSNHTAKQARKSWALLISLLVDHLGLGNQITEEPSQTAQIMPSFNSSPKELLVAG